MSKKPKLNRSVILLLIFSLSFELILPSVIYAAETANTSNESAATAETVAVSTDENTLAPAASATPQAAASASPIQSQTDQDANSTKSGIKIEADKMSGAYLLVHSPMLTYELAESITQSYWDSDQIIYWTFDECMVTERRLRDEDGDGYGDPDKFIQVSVCQIWEDGYVNWIQGRDDCNDADSSMHPDASETCDGVDNNCDGQIDEGCSP